MDWHEAIYALSQLITEQGVADWRSETIAELILDRFEVTKKLPVLAVVSDGDIFYRLNGADTLVVHNEFGTIGSDSSTFVGVSPSTIWYSQDVEDNLWKLFFRFGVIYSGPDVIISFTKNGERNA